MVEEVNSYEKAVSIDIPSGIVPYTGETKSPAFEPDYTVTLAMPKKGMDRENSGEIWVADISVPPEVYSRFEIDAAELFDSGSLVKSNE